MATVAHLAGVFGNSLTWDDLPWLRPLTRLPLILKGICHPDGARRALDAGADGVYVSNHGGRQGNGRAARLVRLGHPLGRGHRQGPSARRNGHRHRPPYAYGLALGDAKGVAHVLRCLVAEADLIMAVDGYPSLADLTPGALRPVKF